MQNEVTRVSNIGQELICIIQISQTTRIGISQAVLQHAIFSISPTDEKRKMVLSVRKYVCSLTALAHSITDLENPLYYA